MIDIEGFKKFAYEHGIFSRTFLKYMYAMVPYVIGESELIQILETMKLGLRNCPFLEYTYISRFANASI